MIINKIQTLGLRCLTGIVIAMGATGFADDWRTGDRLPHPHVGPSSHPLQYDAALGMFGQSDHVGTKYPFSEIALAQRVPSASVAAGLRPSADTGENGVLPSKEIVHHDRHSRDCNAAMIVDEDGAIWVAYTSFRDSDENIYVRKRQSDGWQDEIQISHHSLADFFPTLGRDVDGGIWLIWCRQTEGGDWPLVGRYYDGEQWQTEQVLFGGKNYLPTLKPDPVSGDLWLAWEDWNQGFSRVRTAKWDGRIWASVKEAPGAPGIPQQRPVLEMGHRGEVWLAYDIVEKQKYDVRLARWSGEQWHLQPAPPRIEGHRRRPALATDQNGRVWLLPETLVHEPIEVRRAFYGQEILYNCRPPSRALLIWNGQSWMGLPKGPAMTAKAAAVHIDARGTVWVIGRTPGPGTRDFLATIQRYRGNRWHTGKLSDPRWSGEPQADTHFVLGGTGSGSTKEKVAVVEAGDHLLFAWHHTHRTFTWEPAWTYADGAVDTVLHRLPLEASEYVPPTVVGFDPVYHGTASPEVEVLPHADMERPDHGTIVDGEAYQVYYGDLHHHTEFSRDPGVLNDDVDGNYRYMRDIRRVDFTGLADHTEHLSPHDWYRIRRAAAFYNNEEQFAAFVAFEWTSEFYRGGNYQEGHHNTVYRTDGPEVNYYSASWPISNTPLKLTQRLERDTERAQGNGIESDVFLFPHDPSRSVQPITWSWYNPRIRLLEFVQSRGSHEILGGPQRPPLRNDIQQLVGKSVQDGLRRGFRWGFIGSGDHIGRPLAGVLAPAGDRETIFDSMFAKRTFATTGARMFVRLSVNGHIMGTEWSSDETEHTIDIHAVGTTPITLVEVWKSGRLLRRWSPTYGLNEFKIQLKDPSAPFFRENWWYVRVTQEDGELAWSSPVWFVYTGIEPEVFADAGVRQNNIIVPEFTVPIPILMRNQKSVPVSGTMRLLNVPDDWSLEPGDTIDFELPPDSWETYVWSVDASEATLQELKMVPVELEVEYENGDVVRKPLVVVQSPRRLQTRGQMDEISDAVALQQDRDILDQWLGTMAAKWWPEEEAAGN